MEKNEIVLKDKREYTFQKYNDVIFLNQSSIQSLFNGSIIKNSAINHSNFSKSDFEGTIWNKVSLNNCVFKSCDIKSSIIKDCQFIKCDFSFSIINDTIFRNCVFKDCFFVETIMNQNTFENCSLISASLDASTITLSKFENCIFESLILGDCSFYDHIIVNCKFYDVTINIDSIGRIYGLTMDDLQAFKYIFLGEIYGFAPDIFFEHIDYVFASKEWRLQRTIYLFNIKEINIYDYVISIFKDILFYIENNIIVKHDELVFLLNILKQLKSENHLPLFALYQGIDILNYGIELLENEQYYNRAESFNEFYNECFFIFNDLLLKLSQEHEKLLSIVSEKKDYIFEIHYENNNIIKFDDILNQFLKYNGYDESFHCKLLEIKNGSIIEVISGVLLSVFALQVLLYGINGILIQIADMTTKIQLIGDKKNRKTLLANSIEGKQIQPEILLNSFKLLNNEEFNKNLSSLSTLIDAAKIIEANITDNTTSK